MQHSNLDRFFVPVGYRRNGSPIFPIAGGSVDAPEYTPPAPSPQHTHEPTQPPPTRTFSAEDIERARQEEKDKVYQRLEQERRQRESFEAEVAQYREREEQRQKDEAERQRQADEEARKQAEAEMSAKQLLEERERDWNKRFEDSQASFEERLNQINQEREAERALLEKERELSALQAYAQQRVAEENDNIAPQLRDFVTGNTQEEIDASIESIKAKSAELAEAAQNAFQQARSRMPGVSPTGYTPTGPMAYEGGSRTYSAQDIQNMDMAEYAKLRQSIPGINGSQTNRGMYG